MSDEFKNVRTLPYEIPKSSNSEKFREAINHDMNNRREKWRKETLHRLTQEYFKILLGVNYKNIGQVGNDSMDCCFLNSFCDAQCFASLMIERLEKDMK